MLIIGAISRGHAKMWRVSFRSSSSSLTPMHLTKSQLAPLPLTAQTSTGATFAIFTSSGRLSVTSTTGWSENRSSSTTMWHSMPLQTRQGLGSRCQRLVHHQHLCLKQSLFQAASLLTVVHLRLPLWLHSLPRLHLHFDLILCDITHHILSDLILFSS